MSDITLFRSSKDGRVEWWIIEDEPLNKFIVTKDDEIVFDKHGDFDGAALAFAANAEGE